MNPIELLQQQAMQLQAEPVLAYIRDNYTSWKQFPILEWILDHVEDDTFVLRLYQGLEEMGQPLYEDPSGRTFLYDQPLGRAIDLHRSTAIQIITRTALHWSKPNLINGPHAIIMACMLKEMSIVDAYLEVCGPDFIHDPKILFVILYKDYVELMERCLHLGADPHMRLEDGRTLPEAATSPRMRQLLADPPTPIRY